MKTFIILACFLHSYFTETAIEVEDLTSTQATSISTVSSGDSTFMDEYNTTETSTFVFFNETTSVTAIPFYNETIPKQVTYKPSIASSDLEYCTCDLEPNVCDLNCCCDQGCSLQDKEVFQYCEIEPRDYDTRYCDYINYIYINNTRFQWQIHQNGLFCIIKSNKPPSYMLQRKHPLKTFAEVEYEKRNKFSWPRYESEGIDSFNSSNKIIYGSPVWYMTKNGLNKFEILNSFLTNRCLVKENVYYLKNLHTSCTQPDLSEGNSQLNLKYYIENLKIVVAPKFVNVTKYKEKIFEECPRNICLSIVPKICDTSFTNCFNIQTNDSRINVRCNLNLQHKTNTCLNIVKKLQYIFYHNGTRGITDISLLVILENITYEFGIGGPEVTQEFFVNFFWKNTTAEKSVSLSGNPGYLIGKPIVTGTLLTLTNGTDTMLKIKRNSSESSQHFLIIPTNLNGHCASNSSTYLTVQFGYNLLTHCEFHKTIYSQKKVINATELCRAMQNSILKLWNIDPFKMIGSFGNAAIKNLDEWQRILYEKAPHKILNDTFGIFYQKNNSVFCENLVRLLQIDVFHSRIDIGSLVNQEKILAVAFSFGYTNRSLPFRKSDNALSLDMNLEARVNFYDLSAKKEKKVVDPPSLEIKLPYDFFYPFVRINNNDGIIIAHNFYILAVFLIIPINVF